MTSLPRKIDSVQNGHHLDPGWGIYGYSDGTETPDIPDPSSAVEYAHGSQERGRNNERIALHWPERSSIADPLLHGNSASSINDVIDREHFCKEITGGEEAIAAWNRRFAKRQLELARDALEPFTPGRHLGGGGFGIVNETHLNGIPLALKRTYALRLTQHQLNEIKVLGRISETRHRHIVQLVGSYIHQQRRGFELGLLIWPVAQTDLAALLHDIDCLNRCLFSFHPATYSNKDLKAAMEPLMFFWTQKSGPLKNVGHTSAVELAHICRNRIKRSFGCIAEAVAYLHNQRVRHKDLKPSQVLLSVDGLWLTDFGWSKDMSEASRSATSGGDNITVKYQAPERANRQPCGWPEDIFALGCIFLEMSYITITASGTLLPWSEKGWSFQANLSHVHDWMKGVCTRQYQFSEDELESLKCLMTRMLAHEPRDRPSIDTIIETLSSPPFQDLDYWYNDYFGDCCCKERYQTIHGKAALLKFRTPPGMMSLS